MAPTLLLAQGDLTRMRTSCLPTRNSSLSPKKGVGSKEFTALFGLKAQVWFCYCFYLVRSAMPFASALCTLYVTLVLLGNCNHVTTIHTNMLLDTTASRRPLIDSMTSAKKKVGD